MKLKIGTHDSSTAERPLWYTAWTIPFARTQSKTIAEQYNAGCRAFDIRIRKHRGAWHCAHGLYITKRTAQDIIAEICSFSDRCQVCLTYEGGTGDANVIAEFCEWAEYLRHRYAHIIWGAASIKYGKTSKAFNVAYENVLSPQGLYEGGAQGFLPLDGRSWHTYFPIPWLWDRLYKRPHKFNDSHFTFVDFL